MISCSPSLYLRLFSLSLSRDTSNNRYRGTVPCLCSTTCSKLLHSLRDSVEVFGCPPSFLSRHARSVVPPCKACRYHTHVLPPNYVPTQSTLAPSVPWCIGSMVMHACSSLTTFDFEGQYYHRGSRRRAK